MGRHEKKPSKKKVKIEWSKLVCLLTILAGLLIVQECLFLMYLCIKGATPPRPPGLPLRPA